MIIRNKATTWQNKIVKLTTIRIPCINNVILSINIPQVIFTSLTLQDKLQPTYFQPIIFFLQVFSQIHCLVQYRMSKFYSMAKWNITGKGLIKKYIRVSGNNFIKKNLKQDQANYSHFHHFLKSEWLKIYFNSI